MNTSTRFYLYFKQRGVSNSSIDNADEAGEIVAHTLEILKSNDT